MVETKEQLFTIPLRDAYSPGNRPKRAKIAGRMVREFLEKHTKTEDIKIGNSINNALWARGIQKPPHSVRVHVLKSDKILYAELIGVEIKPPTAEESKKKQAKTTDKKNKIKEARKERKKESIQEQIDAEKGKEGSEVTEVKEKSSEMKEEKQPVKEKHTEDARKPAH